MGRKTSLYLTARDLDRIRALGFPPLGEVLRAGLAVLEQAWPAQAGDDSQRIYGGPAQTSNDSQSSDGGPAQTSNEQPR